MLIRSYFKHTNFLNYTSASSLQSLRKVFFSPLKSSVKSLIMPGYV